MAADASTCTIFPSRVSSANFVPLILWAMPLRTCCGAAGADWPHAGPPVPSTHVNTARRTPAEIQCRCLIRFPSVKSKNAKLLVAGYKDLAVRHHRHDVGVGIVPGSEPAARRALKKLLQGAPCGLSLKGPQTHGSRTGGGTRRGGPRDGPDDRVGRGIRSVR